MSEILLPTEEPHVPGRLVLTSLTLSYSAIRPTGVIISLLIINIGETFKQPVGMTGQLATVNQLTAAIVSLLMILLSVRFSYKSLLLLGLLFINISAVGCFLAFNFSIMLLMFSLAGLGAAMIGPMAFALVGVHFPSEQRTSAIGWINAGIALAVLIGTPIIGIIAEIGNWRWAFLGFVLPMALLSLVMVAIGIPSPAAQSHHTSKGTGQYKEGFKEILTNQSAIACLVGGILAYASFSAIVYSVAFLVERYQISIGSATIFYVGISMFFLVGSLSGGRLAPRFGRKSLSGITGIFMGISIGFWMNISNLWLVLTLAGLSMLFFGIMITVSSSLTLEQVPSFRGTMMSLNSAAWRLGEALGAGLGGLALLLFDYGILGVSLGSMGIVAGLVFYFFTIDPLS